VNLHFARLALITLALTAPANGASTKTIAGIATEWGLIGAWSLDCKLPPDHERGVVLAYQATPDGGVILTRDFGNATEENQVLSVRVSPDRMMNLRVFFPSLKQTRELGLIMEPDGTLRAIYNRDRKKNYSIEDGKFSSSGMPTPAQHRCEKPAG